MSSDHPLCRPLCLALAGSQRRRAPVSARRTDERIQWGEEKRIQSRGPRGPPPSRCDGDDRAPTFRGRLDDDSGGPSEQRPATTQTPTGLAAAAVNALDVRGAMQSEVGWGTRAAQPIPGCCAPSPRHRSAPNLRPPRLPPRGPFLFSFGRGSGRGGFCFGPPSCARGGMGEATPPSPFSASPGGQPEDGDGFPRDRSFCENMTPTGADRKPGSDSDGESAAEFKARRDALGPRRSFPALSARSLCVWGTGHDAEQRVGLSGKTIRTSIVATIIMRGSMGMGCMVF